VHPASGSKNATILASGWSETRHRQQFDAQHLNLDIPSEVQPSFGLPFDNPNRAIFRRRLLAQLQASELVQKVDSMLVRYATDLTDFLSRSRAALSLPETLSALIGRLVTETLASPLHADT